MKKALECERQPARTAFYTSLPMRIFRSLGVFPVMQEPIPMQRIYSLTHAMEMSVSEVRRYALLVEDDEVQRRMVRTILEANGFEVLQSDSAEAAQIIVEEVGHDLTLMMTDVRLSGDMSGSQLAKFAKQVFPNIKVIVTSGRDWPVLPEGAIFLRKPWKPMELIREVQAAAG
jgi:CheY-like chemotaxis protein